MAIEKTKVRRERYGAEEVVIIGGHTVRELVRYCTENDIDLGAATIEYGPCGSHEVILEVPK